MEHYRSGLRRLGWLAFLWGSLYGSVQLQAQVPELRFQHYSVREGLPNITINDLFQDQEGFLWIATWGGLSKYDGYSFTNYHYQPYDTTSLPANDVRCVIQNREGRLFLGLDGGLASYIPEEDQFVRMTPNEGHLKAFRLEDFGLDPSGKVWALFKYGQSKMLEIGPGWNLSWNQKVKAIGNCMIMRDSLMWVGQSGGYKETVQVWSIPQARKLSLESRYPALLALQHVGVTDFKLDRLNRVWIATEAGLYRFDPENESLVALGAIGTPVLNCLYVDRQDRVWVGSEVGLFCLSLEGELLKHYHNDPLDPLSLRDDLITAILVDASENLWVGTEGGGLHKASLATQKAFQTFTGSFFGVNHARLDVFTFAEGKEDRLWVGTNQGLFRLQKSSKQLREHITRRDYPALFSQKIKSLYESPEGLLLIGTDLGLNVLDLKTRRMRRAAGGQPSSASPPQLIRDIIPLTDENAYYLIGQPNRIYLPQSQTFQTLAHRAASQLKTSIHPQYAWQGHATQTGQVWIAENSGLLYWDYAKDSMALHNLGPAREIPERKAICLSPIGDSAFWVGTYGNGFYQIDWQGRVRQHFSEKDGLANNFVFGILPEGERYLWLSTNYGLVRFDREKGAFRTFHREDGLPDEEYETGAFMKASDEEFYFGGRNGFVAFYPAQVEEEASAFEPELAFIQIGTNQQAFSPLDTMISFTSRRGQQLTLSFVAFDFTRPEKNLFQWKLDGLDETWQKPTLRRSISYSQLSPGPYTFMLRGSNSDGSFSSKVKKLHIQVIPRIDQTWWFRLGVPALFILGGLGLVFLRFSRLRQQERQALERRIAYVRQEALSSQMDHHFTFNAMNSIQRFIAQNDVKAATYYISRFGKLMRRMLDQARENFIVLQEEIETLEIYLSLEQLRVKEKFSFEIAVEEAVDPFNQEIPTGLIQPYVENAIWHGIMPKETSGHIQLKFFQQAEYLWCELTDDGIGRAAAQQARLNSRLKHRSRGMAITRERVETLNKMLDWDISIETHDRYNEQGQACGTLVRLKFPIR